MAQNGKPPFSGKTTLGLVTPASWQSFQPTARSTVLQTKDKSGTKRNHHGLIMSYRLTSQLALQFTNKNISTTWPHHKQNRGQQLIRRPETETACSFMIVAPYESHTMTHPIFASIDSSCSTLAGHMGKLGFVCDVEDLWFATAIASNSPSTLPTHQSYLRSKTV